MSRQELHDLLTKLKHEHSNTDLIDSEYQQRLDEIIDSLEQQKLYPDTFDQYSSLNQQIRDLILDYEAQHPTLSRVLKSIHQILNNFKA